ncbi:group XIIB secretory phospholipase A2-like protein isoform X2 [Parambassis ranga]|uniref:Group XIIB secretory phospholipase A2-like protein isoform X2 n=1 Tax=Parambassis ranga TaxID=210632 RepID=A0A6P7JT07_9TELE|nr:group XIIB secretory phospholipase A2-like protein isoform X2 [Parambassis ranga]
MLIRTTFLLLLCMSLGTCATLGFFQTEAKDDTAPAVDSATDGVAAAASEDVAAPDAQVDAANSLFGDSPLAKILARSNKADGAATKQTATDSDRPAGESETLSEEAVTKEQPSSEEETNEIRPVQKNESLNRPLAHEDNSWSLNSIRNSFQTVHGYFDSLVELVGGRDGVCQYRCRYGELPQPRPGYQQQEPNGCSSSLVGFELDMGIPAMTKCCNQLDVCYDTCGTHKSDCDTKFQLCLHSICSDLKKSLGFVTKVQACESMADALYNTVWTLGCRPYMNSQRAACICEGEERDEL